MGGLPYQGSPNVLKQTFEVVATVYLQGMIDIYKEQIIGCIRKFLARTDFDAFAIFYSGHGLEGTGDWIFADEEVTFRDILECLEANFTNLYATGPSGLPKTVYIHSDACYSGKWVLDAYAIPDDCWIKSKIVI